MSDPWKHHHTFHKFTWIKVRVVSLNWLHNHWFWEWHFIFLFLKMFPPKNNVYFNQNWLFYSAKFSQQITSNLNLFYFFSQLEKQWFKQGLSILAERAWLALIHQNSEWQIFNPKLLLTYWHSFKKNKTKQVPWLPSVKKFSNTICHIFFLIVQIR